MAQITNIYTQQLPDARFIGKKYGESDRENGSFGAKWGIWFENGYFDLLEKSCKALVNELYCDGDAYIGYMRWKDGVPFEYWIGMLTEPGTAVPEGFESFDIAASKLGVCWIKGMEYDVYSKEDECLAAVEKDLGKLKPDCEGLFSCFERYVCPRFTTPDENGEVVLDICCIIE